MKGTMRWLDHSAHISDYHGNYYELKIKIGGIRSEHNFETSHSWPSYKGNKKRKKE